MDYLSPVFHIISLFWDYPAPLARSRHGKSMREHHCQNMARNAAASKKITPTASKTQNRRPLKVNFYQ